MYPPTMATIRDDNGNPSLFLVYPDGDHQDIYTSWKKSSAWNAPWTGWEQIRTVTPDMGAVRKLLTSGAYNGRRQLWAWTSKGLWTCWREQGGPRVWSNWYSFGIPRVTITDVTTAVGTNLHFLLAAANGKTYYASRKDPQHPLRWTDWRTLPASPGGALMLSAGYTTWQGQGPQGALILGAATDFGLRKTWFKEDSTRHWDWEPDDDTPGAYGLLSVCTVTAPDKRFLQLSVTDSQIAVRTVSGIASYSVWRFFGMPGPQVTQVAAARLSDGRIQVWALVPGDNVFQGVYTRWMKDKEHFRDWNSNWTDWSRKE